MSLEKDVEYIARLARIELTQAEREKFGPELSAILDFVAKLEEVDTSGVGPFTGGTELENVMREDVVREAGSWKPGADLVEAAPRKREGYVEVKAVFERE